MDYRTIPEEAGQSPSGKGGNDKTTTIIISVVVSVSGVLMLIFSICCILRKRKMRKQKSMLNDYNFDVESFRYDFNNISAATNYFSDENKLGHGFGAVYKGELSNGQKIAVKRLSNDSGEGDLKFKNEVVFVANIRHRNLVKLLGFCIEGTERLLIYEYMPNSSLHHLMLDPVKREELDFGKRFKILVGVAKGLLYLGDKGLLKITHRDLKANNVLLDEEMNPKISDIRRRGSSLFVMDETQVNTSRIVDTNRYMAPEYLNYPKPTSQSDVFSFGVFVLEIVNGGKDLRFRNEKHSEDLPSYIYAWNNWQEGTPTNLIDPILKASSVSMHDIIRCIHIGLLCVQLQDRPTMASVLFMLNSPSLPLPIPSEPAFLWYIRRQLERSRRDEESDSRMMESTLLLKADRSIDR